MANILIPAAKGNLRRAQMAYKASSSETVNFREILIQYALKHFDKANRMASQMDGRVLGPQQLAIAISSYGGIIPFDLNAVPNLTARFREAGIQVEPYEMGAISLERIKQKKL